MGNAARKPGRCANPECRQPYEDPTRTGGLCYGCHLDALIPPWYEDAEEYERITLVDGRVVVLLWRARRRPPTGVDILDAPPPVRVEDIVSRAGLDAIVRRGDVERSQGL